MMTNPLHTVLGATGAMGKAVAAELKARHVEHRLVQRSAEHSGASVRANLLNKEEAEKAIQGSQYVYLCAGLPYSSRVWVRDWPKMMEHVISACEKTHAKLIFLDNVYMYGPAPLTIPFDETHVQNPGTKKGMARKRTTDLLLDAIAHERIEAVIGRSADFYGEYAVNSPFYISFLQNMLKGKPPQVFGQKDVPHTYAYVGDNARALVELAMDDTTHGQVWHLPVGQSITWEEITELFNAELGTDLKTQYIHKNIRKLLSLFISPLREMEEMLYQFENPYDMSDAKFRSKFPGFTTTAYQEGIKRMIKSFGAGLKEKI